MYELNGTLINQLVVFNGKSTNPSHNNYLTQLNEAINLFSSKNNLTERVPSCSTIFFVNVIVNVRTDYYSYITVGNYIQKSLQYSTYSTYNRTEPMNVPCGGSEESYANHYITEFREVLTNVIDPCETATATTTLSKDANFTSAKTSIQTAAIDGFEHSITLGKDTNSAINQAPMNSGNQQYMVSTNYSWAGAIAALHNHPNNTQLSAGDIYASVHLNEKSSSFTTSFILTNGEVYAIVVNDLALAQAFIKTYPADQLPGYSPEFPDFIFNQLQVLVTPMGSSIEGKTTAIAFILDKYNAGITLLKQDSSGDFKPIKTQETTQSNGSKTYNSIPCN